MNLRTLTLVGVATGFAAALVPSPANAALVAAYDRYETGKGFEIGLKDAATGANVALPTGVNTPDDELHPALSSDGRFLVFTRMKLLPKLNGDIVPPTQRKLFWADRQAGTVIEMQGGGGGVGPTFTSKSGPSSALSWGVVPSGSLNSTPPAEGSTLVGQSSGLGTVPVTFGNDIRADVSATRLDVPHAASIASLFTELTNSPGCNPCSSPRTARYLMLATHDPNTGALQASRARLSLFGQVGGLSSQSQSFGVLEFGSPEAPAGHPVPRSGDGYVALDQAAGTDVDIQTITYPGETTPTSAPAPITTTDPERMPAWSPDGIKLGFVRTTGGQRKLGVFDATPGIQTVVNAPIELGADAPTPQTRQFQSVYGGASLAESTIAAPPSPGLTCNASCLSTLKNATVGKSVPLSPSVIRSARVGIFVARVTGTRKLLGRTAPRLRVVGRVPLGVARKGKNSFRWNGKVDGKTLRAGTYVLTYRALQGTRVVDLSDSIRFKVTKSGRIQSPRLLR